MHISPSKIDVELEMSVSTFTAMSMIRVIALGMVLVCCGLGVSAQDGTAEVQELSSAEHIRKLKEGVLLVRLATKQSSIDALKTTGREAQAEQIRAQNLLKNKELLMGMRERFDFCPVYFFYSQDSKYVSSNQLDSVNFLNDELEIDASIVIPEGPVYTAEVALVGQDVSDKVRNISDTEAKDRDNVNEPKYYGGANMRFQALIIKDQNFKQLKRPFPYYARTLNSFFIKRKLSEVAANMNEKLVRFYGK